MKLDNAFHVNFIFDDNLLRSVSGTYRRYADYHRFVREYSRSTNTHYLAEENERVKSYLLTT